jgi:tetratricopeptide (TPR) repeat protein
MRAIGLACLLLLCGAGPASADVLVDCNQGRNAELRLRACSQIIAGADYSPEQKAIAYRNRGNARADAGATSQALADLNEAIRLNPNEVSGFAGRARARLALRDLDGAIADYSQALQLRGIAAPHDEMPKFALSGPEIDTIVAYINSLSATNARPPTTKDKPVVPPRRC